MSYVLIVTEHMHNTSQINTHLYAGAALHLNSSLLQTCYFFQNEKMCGIFEKMRYYLKIR